MLNSHFTSTVQQPLIIPLRLRRRHWTKVNWSFISNFLYQHYNNNNNNNNNDTNSENQNRQIQENMCAHYLFNELILYELIESVRKCFNIFQ